MQWNDKKKKVTHPNSYIFCARATCTHDFFFIKPIFINIILKSLRPVCVWGMFHRNSPPPPPRIQFLFRSEILWIIFLMVCCCEHNAWCGETFLLLFCIVKVCPSFVYLYSDLLLPFLCSTTRAARRGDLYNRADRKRHDDFLTFADGFFFASSSCIFISYIHVTNFNIYGYMEK